MCLPIITSIQLRNTYSNATANITKSSTATAASIMISNKATKIVKIGLGY